jgi:hypothetical protein
MLKAILQYQDTYGSGDEKRVYMLLTKNKIPIIKTEGFVSCNKLTAVFKDYDELQAVLYQLNNTCHYAVRLVSYKKIKDKKVKTKKTKKTKEN